MRAAASNIRSCGAPYLRRHSNALGPFPSWYIKYWGWGLKRMNLFIDPLSGVSSRCKVTPSYSPQRGKGTRTHFFCMARWTFVPRYRDGMQQASWDGHSGEPDISDDSRLLPATTPFLSLWSVQRLDLYPSRIHDPGSLMVSIGILFVEFVCKLTHIVFLSSFLRKKPE